MNVQNAKTIFGEALHLSDPTERQAYVERACGGNETLRQDVESLLRAFEQAGEFFAPTRQVQASDFLVERTGVMIGRYKLLEKIGEGGFGEVYMAEQTEPIQRKVALKIIKPGMDSRQVIARFEAERQALALMDHPNIAKVLDGGATEAGRPYFVMELVRGIPITDYCDQKKLPTSERLQLFIKVCHAVQHAHQKGLIHRDLKPTNVLVTLHDGEPVPKIIDFGVSKALGQKLTAKTLFTGFAQMLGTPAYMSPEQAELSGLDVDTRSDIYSLGVLLYELLTGATPFDKEALAQAALDDLRRMLRETEPPKPSTRLQTLGEKINEVAQRRHTEPVALTRLVRGDLDWIVMKCLEKDRSRRYETANQLLEDVQRHLRNEPVTAAAPSLGYQLQKYLRRHRAGVGVGLAVSCVAIAGLIGIVWQWHEDILAKGAEQRQRRRAEALFTQVQVQRARELIQKDQSGEALACLASALRIDSAQSEATAGLVDILSQRSFLVPASVPFGHPGRLTAATVSAAGNYVASAVGNSVQAWELSTGKPVGPVIMHDAPVTSLHFSWSGALLVSASEDGTVQVNNLQNKESPRIAVHLGAHVVVAEINRREDTLLTVSGTTVQLWDAKSGENLRRELVHPARLTCAQFDPSGENIAAGAEDGTVRVWNIRTGQMLFAPITNETGVSFVAFSPDAQLVLSVAGVAARVRDARTGRPVYISAPVTHERRITSAQFSSDSRLLVTAALDGKIRVSDAVRGTAVGDPIVTRAGVLRVSLSPDDHQLESVTEDNAIRTWDMATRAPLSERRYHTSKIVEAAWACGGVSIVTASEDGTLCMWDARDRKAILQTRATTPPPAPPWLAPLAEAIGGYRLNSTNGLEVISTSQVSQSQRDAVSRQGTEYYARLAKWLFADPARREVNAWSGVSAAQHVEDLLKEDSLTALKEAVRLAPSNGLAYALLAQKTIYGQSRDPAILHEAERLSRQALELAPQSEIVWRVRAEVMAQVGALTPALESANSAVARQPQQPEPWFTKGIVLAQMNNFEDAREAFTKAIELASAPGQALLRKRALLARSATLRQLHRDQEAQADFLEAKAIPPRSPSARAHLIDLTPYYNASLDEDWHQGELLGSNDLAGLPRGVRRFGDIEFDVRGIVQLSGQHLAADRFPKSVDIAIRQKCRAVHFLHAAAWNTADGIYVGKFIFLYADKTKFAKPIVYGEDVRDWWYYPPMPMEASAATVAWKGTNSASKFEGVKFGAGCCVRLYHTRWENPRPECEIVAVSYLSEVTDIAPFLVAITAE